MNAFYIKAVCGFVFLSFSQVALADQLFCEFTEKVQLETKFSFAQDIPEYSRHNNPVQTAMVTLDPTKSVLVSGFVMLNGKRLMISLNDKKTGGNYTISGGVEESFSFQWIHGDRSWIKGDCRIIRLALMNQTKNPNPNDQ